MTKARDQHAVGQPPRQKHVPMRMCVICRERYPKRQITRVVMTDSGLQIDRTGKLNGRGAYLCDQSVCWERAISTDLLGKALRSSLTKDDRECLAQAMPKP